MIINNIFSGLLGLIIGIAMTIVLSPFATEVLLITDSDTKIFLGTLLTITFFFVGLINPLNLTLETDTGGSN